MFKLKCTFIANEISNLYLGQATNQGQYRSERRSCAAVASRSDAGRDRDPQSRQHVFHERRAAVPLTHRHHRRILRFGPIQSRLVPTEQVEFEKVRHEGRSHRTVGAHTQSALGLPILSRIEYRLQGMLGFVKQSFMIFG